MKQYTFVLNFGYAESANLSFFPFTSIEKHKDAKEALVDLAEFLKEQYLLCLEPPEPRRCCVVSKKKDSEAEFCSKCGKRLNSEGFEDEGFIGWLYEMSGANTNSFHSKFIEYNEDHRWQSIGLEGAAGPRTNQRFVYHADWVLAAALGYPQNKDRTFEKICQDRTKAKLKSFSYYM